MRKFLQLLLGKRYTTYTDPNGGTPCCHPPIPNYSTDFDTAITIITGYTCYRAAPPPDDDCCLIISSCTTTSRHCSIGAGGCGGNSDTVDGSCVHG
ncbi:unnamed protein product, partial [Rotaria sp. Silwood1]